MIIKRCSAGSGGSANTNIIAQMSGTILEIPVKEGDQVIQSNNFNAASKYFFSPSLSPETTAKS